MRKGVYWTADLLLWLGEGWLLEDGDERANVLPVAVCMIFERDETGTKRYEYERRYCRVFCCKCWTLPGVDLFFRLLSSSFSLERREIGASLGYG